MFKWVSITFILLAFWGCREESAGVDFRDPTVDLFDTTFIAATESPDTKVVVMEEFTGVRCEPCVNGHIKAEQLIAASPGQIAVVSYHAAALSSPFSNSKENYNTTDGTLILQWFGIASFPISVIDRRMFSGETALGVDIALWETRVNEQLMEVPPVNVRLTNTIFSPTSGVFHLIGRVEAAFTQNVTEPARITVMIAENRIIDSQETSMGEDPDYEHMHVFRGMLTPWNGSNITSTTEEGRVIIQEFVFEDLPGHWDLDNCEVIAIVH